MTSNTAKRVATKRKNTNVGETNSIPITPVIDNPLPEKPPVALTAFQMKHYKYFREICGYMLAASDVMTLVAFVKQLDANEKARRRGKETSAVIFKLVALGDKLGMNPRARNALGKQAYKQKNVESLDGGNVIRINRQRNRRKLVV